MATRTSRPERSATWQSLRLTHIDVANYKSLDNLSLALPAPHTEDQLDAFVLGSKNGVGKSSLLECCALGISGAMFRLSPARERRPRNLIRAGADKATIGLSLELEGTVYLAEVEISPTGLAARKAPTLRAAADRMELHEVVFDAGDLLDSLLGINSEPLIVPPVLLFHSYRKVLEGSAALGAMLGTTFVQRHLAPAVSGPNPLSAFKVVLVQALMARSGLFEGIESVSDNEAVVDRLNGLIRDFAGGNVDKLRPGPDGTLELRVAPVSGGASFSFDGLSSGQKEIIATLFLIWYMTRDRPSLVLIDEPELHLNAEWQRVFVHKLAEMAPTNQYILATHSEEIFQSVTEDRRLLLEPK
jgi:AAA ATPase domain